MGLQGCDGGSRFICLIIQKHDLCGRIEDKVEAFRYYLVLKSGQFQLRKIIDQMAPALVFVIYLSGNG